MTNEIIKQRDVTDNILTRVDEMKNEGLALPSNYNASNALNLAFLQLVDMKVKQKPLLEVVTKKSIQESLLNMVLQGLTPGKNQVYFIPYGQELQMQRSYFGTQAVLKRLNGVNDIWANVIYDGDDFEIEIDEKGRERLQNHKTSFFNKDNNIVGAYAIIDTDHDGQLLTAMTKKQIDASWSQARTKNVHNKFPEEMAKRTVINRAAKNYINTSDDSDMLTQAINETTENEYDQEQRRKDVTEEPKAEKTNSLLEEFNQQEEKPEEEKESQEAESVEVDFEEVDEDDIPPAVKESIDSVPESYEESEEDNNGEEQVELFDGSTTNPNGQ